MKARISAQPASHATNVVQRVSPLAVPEQRQSAKSSDQSAPSILSMPVSQDLNRVPIFSPTTMHAHQPATGGLIQRKAAAAVRARRNTTGLPDHLKTGIEGLSGLSLDDVQVHYNSSKPAEVNAFAYTQGRNIYMGPGQEQHLAHEAWHVVQQKQGRVSATMQTKGVSINDDQGLEREADVMGAKAVQTRAGSVRQPKTANANRLTLSTGMPVAQMLARSGLRKGTRVKIRDDDRVGEIVEEQYRRGGYYVLIGERERFYYYYELDEYDVRSRERTRGRSRSRSRSRERFSSRHSRRSPSRGRSSRYSDNEDDYDERGRSPKASSKNPRGRKHLRSHTPEDTANASKLIRREGEGVNRQVVPVAPQQPEQQLPNIVFRDIITNILKNLSPEQLLVMRLVSKFFSNIAESLLVRLVRVSPYSSLIEDRDLLTVLTQEVHQVVGRLYLSVDQLDLTQLGRILDEDDQLRRAIRINYGSNLKESRSNSRRDYPYLQQTAGPGGGGKMHNKFLVGSSTVLTGSPNYTESGLTRNIEVIIKIANNPLIAGFFREYFRVIRDSRRETRSLTNALTHFNGIQNNPVQLALAPLIDIGQFITAQLVGRDTVIVRMFLVSLKGGQRAMAGGIVESLAALADSRQAQVTVVIDQSQYDNQGFVQAAVEYLIRNGVTVYTQQSRNKDIMHEKLILAATSTREGTLANKRVLTGSSGLTTSVMGNRNYENFISIDDDALFDYFTGHHEQSLRSRAVQTIKL